jgi:hypothetical protein
LVEPNTVVSQNDREKVWEKRTIETIAEMGKMADVEREKNKHLSAEDLKEKMTNWSKKNGNVLVLFIPIRANCYQHQPIFGTAIPLCNYFIDLLHFYLNITNRLFLLLRAIAKKKNTWRKLLDVMKNNIKE